MILVINGKTYPGTSMSDLSLKRTLELQRELVTTGISSARTWGEVQGLIKFPGTSFVIPFRGIRHQDRWVARALGPQAFHGPVFFGTGGSNPNPGMGPLDTSGRQFPQIEFNDARLQIGTGSFIDYAQDGDAAA